jgi:hypothetical protein
MKKCPQCSRTYSDDTLSFCLEDGALLSATYDPQETQTPTVAISAGEVPTVVAREIPTIVAAKEIPTVVNSSRVTEQTENPRVQWYVYLLGLFISWIIYFTTYNYLFDAAVIPLSNLVISSISNLMGDALVPYYHFLFTMPYNLMFYGIITMALGFIWSGAKWRWGLIAVILPAYQLIYVLYSFRTYPYIIVAELLIYFLTILFACLGSYAGSRLKSRV